VRKSYTEAIAVVIVSASAGAAANKNIQLDAMADKQRQNIIPRLRAALQMRCNEVALLV